MDRRRFLNTTTVVASAAVAPALSFAQNARALVTRDAMRPQMAQGIQSGDPTTSSAVIWTRGDRPARMWAEWATTASFANATRVRGPYLMEDNDFTGRMDLTQLPAGEEIFYRVVLQDLHNERVLSEAMPGHLRLPVAASKNTS